MTFGAVPSLHGPQGQTSLLPCSWWLLETWEIMPSALPSTSQTGVALCGVPQYRKLLSNRCRNFSDQLEK